MRFAQISTGAESALPTSPATTPGHAGMVQQVPREIPETFHESSLTRPGFIFKKS